jgi:hypothetical protein
MKETLAGGLHRAKDDDTRIANDVVEGRFGIVMLQGRLRQERLTFAAGITLQCPLEKCEIALLEHLRPQVAALVDGGFFRYPEWIGDLYVRVVNDRRD